MREAALVLMALASLAGCKTPVNEAPPEATGGAVVTAPAASTPADYLAPGELVEGSERAFGLVLPKGVRVDETFVDVAYASGPFAVHPLVQYLQARVEGGGIREGTSSATFEHVHAPARPDLELQVHLSTWAGGTRIEIRDATPPPAPILPDEPSRWRRVGLTPQGRLADPTHLD